MKKKPVNMPTCGKIIVDLNKKGAILQGPPNIMKLVREKFSVKNPSYQMAKFVPRLYSITPIGAFQIGLWNEIEHYIRSLNLPITIEVTDAFREQYKPNLGISKISNIPGFNYYDYQEITLNEFLKNGRGISMIATGGGKSLIIGGMCKTILDNKPNAKILVCVPNIGLLNQLYDSFINEFHIDSVTCWGDKKLPDLSKNVLISNSQMLTSDLTASVKVLKDYDIVIVDEVHTLGMKKNQISKVIHNIKTPHKFGLTGTLPNDIQAAWNVLGKIGPILYEKSSYELRQQGTITDVEVRIVRCIHKKKPEKVENINPTDKYNAELSFVIDSEERNDLIERLALKLPGNTLIIVDRLAYADNIYRRLLDKGKRIFLITGETTTEERTTIQNLMDSEDNIITVAMSKCFSTGISVKNIHNAIFAYMGKDGVKTIQTIGRTLRKHHSKKKSYIYDFADNLKYSLVHLAERIKIYEDQKIEYKITDKKF